MSSNLNDTQLRIVMHLCNGLEIKEIAEELHYSVTNIGYHIKQAKKTVGARNTAHLCSIVIASGDLVWLDDENERALQSE